MRRRNNASLPIFLLTTYVAFSDCEAFMREAERKPSRRLRRPPGSVQLQPKHR
jgi:hypothetical protein